MTITTTRMIKFTRKLFSNFAENKVKSDTRKILIFYRSKILSLDFIEKNAKRGKENASCPKWNKVDEEGETRKEGNNES